MKFHIKIEKEKIYWLLLYIQSRNSSKLKNFISFAVNFKKREKYSTFSLYLLELILYSMKDAEVNGVIFKGFPKIVNFFSLCIFSTKNEEKEKKIC